MPPAQAQVRFSRGVRRFLPWLIFTVSLLVGWQLAAQLASQGRWTSALYCIQQRGLIWGVAPLPPALAPTCPQSSTYRLEVRNGETKVEQYRVPGWQPRAALLPLRQNGYVILTKELEGTGSYSAFLGQQLPGELQYTAVQDGPDTLITISGP